jgi:hypothetical protein
MDIENGFPVFTGPSINEEAHLPYAGERKLSSTYYLDRILI